MNNLTGTPKEQANQLIEILKETHVTVEELDKILPITTEFFKELGIAINNTIEAEKTREANYTNFMNNISSTLCDVLRDGVITKEERLEILRLLERLSELMTEAKKNKDDDDGRVKTTLIGVGASLLALILVILGGSKNS